MPPIPTVKHNRRAIRRQRELLGLTPERAAEQAGLHPGTWRNLENYDASNIAPDVSAAKLRRRQCGRKTLQRMAAVLLVEIDDLSLPEITEAAS
ncbi:helix-turn-helix domain-containing protein [Nocardiopsis flavescens]|uniref:helix-turn-helix domain-containing protein n=1 Tax=Nocardiopsis flavescens TaxID=758803 RepID=UPI003658CDD2